MPTDTNKGSEDTMWCAAKTSVDLFGSITDGVPFSRYITFAEYCTGDIFDKSGYTRVPRNSRT